MKLYRLSKAYKDRERERERESVCVRYIKIATFIERMSIKRKVGLKGQKQEVVENIQLYDNE